MESHARDHERFINVARYAVKAVAYCSHVLRESSLIRYFKKCFSGLELVYKVQILQSDWLNLLCAV